MLAFPVLIPATAGCRVEVLPLEWGKTLLVFSVPGLRRYTAENPHAPLELVYCPTAKSLLVFIEYLSQKEQVDCVAYNAAWDCSGAEFRWSPGELRAALAANPN